MPENKDEISYGGGDLFRAAKENRSDIARALLDRVLSELSVGAE